VSCDRRPLIIIIIIITTGEGSRAGEEVRWSRRGGAGKGRARATLEG
jgi:hypothetical protein